MIKAVGPCCNSFNIVKGSTRTGQKELMRRGCGRSFESAVETNGSQVIAAQKALLRVHFTLDCQLWRKPVAIHAWASAFQAWLVANVFSAVRYHILATISYRRLVIRYRSLRPDDLTPETWSRMDVSILGIEEGRSGQEEAHSRGNHQQA